MHSLLQNVFWLSLFWPEVTNSALTEFTGLDGACGYLDVVKDGCGDISVQIDQSFLLQQLWQRAVAQKKKDTLHSVI